MEVVYRYIDSWKEIRRGVVLEAVGQKGSISHSE